MAAAAFEQRDLDVRQVRDACLVPATRDRDAELRLRLGAYGPDGQSIEEVRLVRYQRACGLAPNQPPAGAPIPEAVYGGVLLDKFGHFLIESLARAWWLRAHPGAPVLWHTVHDGLKGWQRQIFEMLGIQVTDESLVREPRAVSRLTVPASGQVIGLGFHPRNLAAIEVFEFGEPIPGRKVWLSRSRLDERQGRVLGEEELESRLRQRGWEVVHPETMAVADQLQAMARAGTIAGFQGSAFHLLLLAKNVRAKIRIVHRGRRWIHPAYGHIAESKKLDQRTQFVPMRKLSGGANREVFRLTEFSAVIGFVDGDGVPEEGDPEPMNATNQAAAAGAGAGKSKSHSARRINALAAAIKARTYLEIGVSRGHTLLAVEIARKTGVDPRFRFDTAGVDAASTRLNEMTSDEYFARLGSREKFDFIFIDGQHTFEQAYRDVCNALAHLADGGIILINGTRPDDVYSALRNQGQALAERARSGSGADRRWQGDVFKVVCALHDFHPSLNYRTIVGAGSPQTLVWASKAGWRSPRFDCLEAITRLSYFDLQEHLDILREASEEEAIGLCLEELRHR